MKLEDIEKANNLRLELDKLTKLSKSAERGGVAWLLSRLASGPGVTIDMSTDYGPQAIWAAINVLTDGIHAELKELGVEFPLEYVVLPEDEFSVEEKEVRTDAWDLTLNRGKDSPSWVAWDEVFVVQIEYATVLRWPTMETFVFKTRDNATSYLRRNGFKESKIPPNTWSRADVDHVVQATAVILLKRVIEDLR